MNAIETPSQNQFDIPRDRIRANPRNARVLFDESELKALGATIKANGLIHPLVVRYAPSRFDGVPWLLIDGERRFRASEGILDVLPCIVREVEEGKERELSLIANLQRTDLTAYEEARGVSEFIENGGLTVKDAARALGYSSDWVYDRLKLLKTGEDVLAVAEVTPAAMDSLLLIDKVKDKPFRANLLQQVKTGTGHAAIKSQVKEHQSPKQSTHAPDAQTQTRINQIESNGHGTMSRGVLVTGTKSSDAKQVIETALLRMETDFKSLSNYYDSAPVAARKAAKKRLYELSKKFGELA